MRIAVYPGTFDPITLGHVNVVERGINVFDKIVIACNRGRHKKTLFTLEERAEMLRGVFAKTPRIEIDTFDGLLVHYLAKRGTTTILRGIRTVEDFEYEHQMTLANRSLDKRIETVFMLTDGEFSHMSSSIIKEIAMLGGAIDGMVPLLVAQALQRKLKESGTLT